MHSIVPTLRNILPEAIYCLHTCCVYVMLLELCCMQTSIATFASMRQLKDIV